MDASRPWRPRASQPGTPQQPLQRWKRLQGTFPFKVQTGQAAAAAEKQGPGAPQQAPPNGCPPGEPFASCSLPLLCYLSPGGEMLRGVGGGVGGTLLGP